MKARQNMFRRQIILLSVMFATSQSQMSTILPGTFVKIYFVLAAFSDKFHYKKYSKWKNFPTFFLLLKQILL